MTKCASIDCNEQVTTTEVLYGQLVELCVDHGKQASLGNWENIKVGKDSNETV